MRRRAQCIARIGATAPPVRRRSDTCTVPHLLLGPLATAIMLRRGVHGGIAEQRVHRDEIDVVIKQLAGDGAMNGMSKDGHDRSPLGRSASRMLRPKSVHASPAAASRPRPGGCAPCSLSARSTLRWGSNRCHLRSVTTLICAQDVSQAGAPSHTATPVPATVEKTPANPVRSLLPWHEAHQRAARGGTCCVR